jgi:serine/threonine protein phosphatase PrpC
MEDYHFYQELDNGVLTGVFDGHGGKIGGNPQELAKLVGERFAKNFPNKLSENNGDVHKTFMELCSEIQQEVEAKGSEDERWQYFGSTAVISFVDKRTHKIYTATIGDAEAHIYRKINGECKAIPLSPIRDWGYRKEITRAQRVAEKCSYVKARMNKWPLDARCKRFPDKTNQYGINTSRSFGDSAYTMAKFDKKDKDKYDTAVISKPKITVNELQPGDILVLACDGLREAWDLCKEEPLDIDEIEEGIIGTLTTENQQEDLAKSLVRHAVDVQHSQDNVSVIAVKVS